MTERELKKSMQFIAEDNAQLRLLAFQSGKPFATLDAHVKALRTLAKVTGKG